MADETRPTLSVVVPTRDRAQCIPSFLSSLDACERPQGGVEVLLVDDGSVPAVQLPVPTVLGGRVRLLRQRRLGPAAARNLGAQAARGRCLLFLADDLELDHSLLLEHLAAHRGRDTDGVPWVFVGPIEPPPRFSMSPFEAWLWRSGIHFDFEAVRREWSEQGALGAERCYASNLSVSSQAFEQLGGFDRGFPHAAFEDLDFGHRWLGVGHRIGFVASARVRTTALGGTSVLGYLEWKRSGLASAYRLLRRAPELAGGLARARAPRHLDRWSRVRKAGACVALLDSMGLPLPGGVYRSLLAPLAPVRRPLPTAEAPLLAGRVVRDPLSGRVSFDARRSDSVLASELLIEALAAFQDVVPRPRSPGGGESHERRIVEVGCGAGPLRVVLGIGPDAYVGLDRDASASASHLLADAGELPLAPETATLVICSEVLEHLRSPEQALGEISRILVPGGRVLISTPFFYRMHDRPEDRWRFTEQGLRVLLEGAGFRVERMRAVGGALSVVADVLCRVALPLVVRPVRALGELLGLGGLVRVGGALEHRVSVLAQRAFLALRGMGLDRMRARGGGDRRAHFLWDRSSRITKGYVLLASKPGTAEP